MAARKQWSDLSERNRRLLIAAAVVEGILKVAVLVDLKRRPANQVRGPKWLWAAVVAVAARLIPSLVAEGDGYCLAMATRRRYYGVIRWSASAASSPRSIWTQFTSPVNSLPRGP